ncbi:MAG: hypothetical protein JWP96_910 [Polaromonas sp.]|nr:hypothetical protein [Polaromonas sp.]
MRQFPFPRLYLYAALWLAPLWLAAPASAQPALAQRESAVKAAFLFKFGAFVDWPAGMFKRPDEPLVIGIAGDEAVATDLEQLAAGRTLAGRPVKTVRLNGADVSPDVHVLFLGYQRGPRLREAITSVSGPVLVVTDQAGALQLGSLINFSTVAGRIRFSVSLAAAEARSLKLSSRLLAVAQAVEGGAP